ncbi:hypothetical protein V1506DRAFT_508979 [Lipomyces tetrasporus]
MRRKYLEKKARKETPRGAAGSRTAAGLVDAARQIVESAILSDQYKLDVLQMGILPLRDLAELSRSSWRTSEVPTLPQSAVDEVPSVARFLSSSREIDAADLVPAWSNRAELVEEVMACLEDFTGSNLLERVDMTWRTSSPRFMTRKVSDSTL